MKRIFLICIFFPVVIFSQYYNERTTEQSFEKSELYFNSFYLNTFGMKNFKQASIGMINDPFLNIYLNPAIIPEFKENSAIFYLDFRGDRTEEAIVSSYVMPAYLNYVRRPIYDRRWISITRTEPEPTFSFGVLMNPIKEISQNFYVGGVYQMIRREEKFYESPYWIYNSIYLYDSFGNRAEGITDIPIIDRYSAKNEMTTEAHLYSLFTGYKIYESLSLGLSFNGVIHNRDGGYLDANNDDYGNIDNSFWENKNSRDKFQDYNHTDFSAGIMYAFTDKLKAGLKLGILNGDADQKLNSANYYKYDYGTPVPNNNWSNSYSNSDSRQTWKHDGTYQYGSINFVYIPKEGKSITGYYKYTNGNEDLTSTSAVVDTSYYISRWTNTYNNIQDVHDFSGKSSVKDIRSGNGERKEKNYEGMINFSSELTPWSKLTTGIYINERNYEIITSEPVTLHRYSEYHSKSTGNYNYEYNNLLILDEIKTLEWNYNAEYWTMQIPVMLDFIINEHFGVMIGINRILKNWKIREETIAVFSLRRRNENGVIKEEKNFGERYSAAVEKYTENETDLFTKLNVNINSEFKINLLVDPEFENLFRVAQWWLSFEARL